MLGNDLERLFVAGAGTMGRGIAQTALTAGMTVTLYDPFSAALDGARDQITAALGREVKKERMTQAAADDCLSRLITTENAADAKTADIVIEAAKEDLELKKDLFRELSDIVSKDCLICSNTSSLSIDDMAEAISDPGRFMGTHFFNPVPVMKLLEIVRGAKTREESIDAVRAMGERWGKIYIVAADSPGFIANRIGSPMLNEAVNVLNDGIGSAEDIDKAMKYGWGWPMGPLELLDMVGLDIELALMDVFYEKFKEPYYQASPLLRKMVEEGRLGRKTGRGFYEYDK